MTEEARKRTGSAKDTAQGAKEYAQQTVDAGSDYIKDTQQQGESAWQKVKDRVTETVDKVIPCFTSKPCREQPPSLMAILSILAGNV